MSRSELPEGVPPDNTKADFSAGRGDGYRAPDVATPTFARATAPGASDPEPLRKGMDVVIIDRGDDDDEEAARKAARKAKAKKKKEKRLLYVAIGTAVAALFFAFIAIAIASSKSRLPLCSDQPEWNQYNCRQG